MNEMKVLIGVFALCMASVGNAALAHQSLDKLRLNPEKTDSIQQYIQQGD